MSYMVARMQKNEELGIWVAHISTMNGFLKSTQTKTSTRAGHTLNYELTDRDRSVCRMNGQIKDYVNGDRVLNVGYGKTLFCVMNGLLRQIKIFLKSWARSRRENFLGNG